MKLSANSCAGSGTIAAHNSQKYLVEPLLVPPPDFVDLLGIALVHERSGHDDAAVLGEHDALNAVVVVVVNLEIRLMYNTVNIKSSMKEKLIK